MNERIKNLIITITILVLIILVFVLFANPLPKKVKDKTYQEKLATTDKIDIIIHSPYDNNFISKASKTITKQKEITTITDNIKEANITEEIFNGEENDHFYFTLLLKNEDNKNNLNILFKDGIISIDGKIAILDSESYAKVKDYILTNINGFGTLNCKKETPNNTIIEKYYFKENNIYHYNKSQTFIPEDTDIEIKNINKYNQYNGVSAIGNMLDNQRYSYVIDIDLTIISDDNYQTITKKSKKELELKNVEDLIKDKKDMVCNYNFL